ncbi:MAG: NUDIX hydrolase [Planctomycetes bacterium]|nr:NUDIX hydrolase [Planctomycetota bacterium]
MNNSSDGSVYTTPTRHVVTDPEGLVSRETTYRGARLHLERLVIKPPAGPNGRSRPGELVRDVVRLAGAVVILPILDDGRIVLIRNLRHAVNRTLWELPAGMLEPDEKPETCAGRELIEETGYRSDRVEYLASFYTTPGFCDEFMHAFVASGLRFVGQQLEADEDIETAVRTPEEVHGMIADGQLIDAKSILTVLLYESGIRPGRS